MRQEDFNLNKEIMAEIKTQRNKASVTKFLSSIEDEVRRKDGKALLGLFKAVLKEKPEMWGTSIVGFGSYNYKSERSTQQGEWMFAGFSPRKQNLTVYIIAEPERFPELLSKLGKFKISKGSCLYINRLSDVDTKILQSLIKQSVAYMKEKHTNKK